MKIIFSFLFTTFFISTAAQTRSDPLLLIKKSALLFDLYFSDAEVDSMFDGVKENMQLFNNMHRFPTPNELPYPFAFNPSPQGSAIPTQQKKIKWDIPSNVTLPVNSNDLAFYSIPQLASLIKNKKISFVALTTFFLNRLKKWADTLQCVINLTEDIAMQQAQQADDDLKKGIYHGPLHGIPYGLKDLFAVKGTRTTWGGTPYKDQVINEDAFVYLQLKKAGAVLCAKFTLGALAMGDVWFGGITRDPWDLTRGSSGSSAGSTAATVAGLIPFAIGTETLGSIVSPSHRCGATGLRPTFGSVSRSGAMVLSWSLDKIGPICRSAEDAAIVFYYIKGRDEKDPSSITRAFNYTGHSDLKKLRIGYAANYFKQLPQTSLQWNVIETFKRLGANIKEINFPDSAIYPFNMISPIINAESAAAFDDLTRSDKDDLLTGQQKNDWPNNFREARLIPAVEYINANRHRYTLIKSFHDFMKDYDVIILPTFAGSQLAITNLTGNPVVCMPIGFLQNGLPNSITLLGNLYDEETILSAAKAYQDATEFNKVHPQKFKN